MLKPFFISVTTNFFHKLLQCSSSLDRLLRILCYLRRIYQRRLSTRTTQFVVVSSLIIDSRNYAINVYENDCYSICLKTTREHFRAFSRQTPSQPATLNHYSFINVVWYLTKHPATNQPSYPCCFDSSWWCCRLRTSRQADRWVSSACSTTLLHPTWPPGVPWLLSVIPA